MSSTSDSFKHESLQDCESITKYINALSDGFTQGALVFMSDGQRVVLKPQGLIKLEVEAKRKDRQIRLALKFRWTEEDTDAGDLAVKPLVISSGERE